MSSDDYVIVYCLHVDGQGFHTATDDPDDFGRIVADHVRQFRTAPVCERADIAILSMPRAKWDKYGEESA